MLAVAERYAQGIVWADDHKADHTQELEFFKRNAPDMVQNPGEPGEIII